LTEIGLKRDEKRETPLRLFLQASMLSTSEDSGKDGGEKDVSSSSNFGATRSNSAQDGQKVTISTCHSAKGLEWPVVMVPAGKFTTACFQREPFLTSVDLVERGTFPFYRSEDVEEERCVCFFPENEAH
jgi:DNA helicase-2/ATP-dependent DNA helicase PcrA